MIQAKSTPLRLVILLVCLGSVPAQEARVSSLTVKLGSTEKPGTTLVTRLYRLAVHRPGQVVRLSKLDVFDRKPSRQSVTEVAGSAAKSVFGRVDPGHYAVFAFADRNNDGNWDPGLPEPSGWYAARPGGRLDHFELKAGESATIVIRLRAPTPFPTDDRRTDHGALTRIKGYPVLQLSGNARQRGRAHGFLVARQILDFFEFYILEDKFRSIEKYATTFAPFLEKNFAYPTEFIEEADAVIEGMREFGVDLHVPGLDRDFNRTDLCAINAYIEARAMRSSCTQFAVWGDATAGTDVGGKIVTGRNMDGEIDLRKTTVHGFLLFAVNPAEPDQKRYVSMMWPGFIGTISGINEDGFYSMENAGPSGPGAVVDRLVPISWTQRMALATLGADATPESVEALLKKYASSGGGACGPGSVILWAVPYREQSDPAFIYEGDRFGGAMRRSSDVRPRAATDIMGSNHYLIYGCQPDRARTNFGKRAGFSTSWRYETGMHKLESFRRLEKPIGTAEMRELLQSVCHGTTEYAIITRPNELSFDVAVASLKAEAWDAPYRRWTRFAFEDLFRSAPSPSQR